MEAPRQTRFGKIENLRALAIILVVFGHSIILYSSSWNLYQTIYEVQFLDQIKNVINLIQMPLFFSISGYLFDPEKEWNKLLLGKGKRLLVPYLFFACAWMVPIRLLVGYAGYSNKSVLSILIYDILGYHDNGHLWYLPCLFACFIIGKILCNIFSSLKFRILSVGVVILGLIASYYGRNIDQIFIKYIAMYFVWFYVGYLLRHNKVWFLWIIVSIAVVLYELLQIGEIDIIVTFVVLLILYILTPQKACRVTEFISKYSFGIYLFHSPLIYITFAYGADLLPIYVVFINFVIWGGVATLLSYGIAKTPLCIVLGMNYRKKREA